MKKKKRVATKRPSKQRVQGIIYLRPPTWIDDVLEEEALCVDYCKENNIEFTKVFCDESEDKSNATILESPGFNEMLDYCKNHWDKAVVLVVANRDRLGTNTLEYLRCKIDIHRLGVQILSVTNAQPVDCPIEQICELIDEYKRQEKI